jgi:hypothetical protein
MCLGLAIAALFLLKRLSNTWRVMGRGEVDYVIYSPPILPIFFEPFLGFHLTRGYYEVHFTDGQSCSCIGVPPDDLQPGDTLTISVNALLEARVEKIH